MRFAYIDSQGNEVAIPSEDALRLRIELGAITDATSFFDAQGGQWAPAAEHDAFRRLRGELSGEGPGAAAPSSYGGRGWGEGRPTGPREVTFPASPDSVVEPAPPSAEDPQGVATGEADDAFDFGDFGALDLEIEAPIPVRPPTPQPDPANAYGIEPPTPAPSAPPTDDPDRDPWTVPGRDPWTADADDSAGGGSGLGAVGFGDEPPPGWEPGGPQPHPFEAEDGMPEWLRSDPEFGEDAAVEDGGPVEFPSREEMRERSPEPAPTRAPKRAPSRPRRRGRGWGASLVPAAGLVLLLGAGTFWVVGRGGGAEELPEIVRLPSIAPSLEPVMRTAQGQALPVLIDSLRGLPLATDLPEEVNADWLGGRYMANASAFPDVRRYWESVGRYVQVMQAKEAELFERALAVALDTITLPEDDRRIVTTRALAGFEATAPDRRAVYDQLRSAADAALTLQIFLEQNEANIDYEPAVAGLSRDPVLEAVPITPSLGEEMWNHVAAITSALDTLGFLDRVTTEGLLGVFFTKLAAVPLR